MQMLRFLPALQKVIRVALWVLCAVAGVALIMYPPSRLYEVIVLPMPDSWVVRVLVGAVFTALALIALAPLPKRLGRGKSISFTDDLGTDTVHLTPLERTLKKEVCTQPEVKRAWVFLSPTDDKHGVRVRAEVMLRKAPNVSSNEVRLRLKNYLAAQARQLLGTEEVAGVELDVLDISVEKTAAPAVQEPPVASPDGESPALEDQLVPPDTPSAPEDEEDVQHAPPFETEPDEERLPGRLLTERESTSFQDLEEASAKPEENDEQEPPLS